MDLNFTLLIWQVNIFFISILTSYNTFLSMVFLCSLNGFISPVLNMCKCVWVCVCVCVCDEDGESEGEFFRCKFRNLQITRKWHSSKFYIFFREYNLVSQKIWSFYHIQKWRYIILVTKWVLIFYSFHWHVNYSFLIYNFSLHFYSNYSLVFLEIWGSFHG